MQTGGHVTRLALHVIQGDGISGAAVNTPDPELFITVRTAYGRKIFQTRRKAVHNGVAPVWDLSCVVDLTQDAPMDTTVFIEVRKSQALRVGRGKQICSYFGCVDDLLRASIPYTVGHRSKHVVVCTCTNCTWPCTIGQQQLCTPNNAGILLTSCVQSLLIGLNRFPHLLGAWKAIFS
jgi:hypothetical protein